MKRKSKIWLLEDNLFIKLFNKANTIKEFVELCGLKDIGSNRNTVKRRIENLKLDINILKNKSKEYREKNFHFLNHLNKYKIEDIFIKNSSVDRTTIKDYIRKYNLLKQNQCSLCGLKKIWNNKPITFILDHINGINNDNRIENLRYLCPNCNSQTETFAGRNNKKINTNKCINCGKKIHKKSIRCSNCAAIENNKKNKKRPSLDELKRYLNLSNIEIAKIYKVSETTIRKWKKIYKFAE